jgi:hypothetical protein
VIEGQVVYRDTPGPLGRNDAVAALADRLDSDDFFACDLTTVERAPTTRPDAEVTEERRIAA